MWRKSREFENRSEWMLESCLVKFRRTLEFGGKNMRGFFKKSTVTRIIVLYIIHLLSNIIILLYLSTTNTHTAADQQERLVDAKQHLDKEWDTPYEMALQYSNSWEYKSQRKKKRLKIMFFEKFYHVKKRADKEHLYFLK